MATTKDRTGKDLAVGDIVLIPMKILRIFDSVAPGAKNVDVELIDEVKLDSDRRVPWFCALNNMQMERSQ